ncbi:MAG TPA: phosphomannomutase/phosphoglucomutase [Ruania sp.]|nr:phosphomannomutase/phosphoglucomutase [Ruania sp.]
MSELDAIVKAYDIRGLVPQEWDEEVAQALGGAFADVVSATDHATGLVIGHDMRATSPSLARAFAQGATWRGLEVRFIGLCSTDGLYFASGRLDLPGAMFTASHNPAEYNGIKLCRSGARPVGQETGLADVHHLAQQYVEEGIPAAAGTGECTEVDMLTDYAQHLRTLVDLSGLRPLKVVVDAANGMAGLTVPAVLGQAVGLPELDVQLVPLFFDLDGTFPNHEANPLDPANLMDLQTAVIAEQADIGLAFDGDADRCFVVDEKGVPVSASAITALVGLREVERELEAGREPTIIHNHITSRIVPSIVASSGGRTVRTRVGHSYIKAQMAEHGAVFGGEHSGHYYFRDFWYADTGMLAAMHVLRALGERTAALSELAEMFTPYFASGEINSHVEDVPAAEDRVREAFAEDIAAGTVLVEEFDGVTFSHWDSTPRWWFNLRASNTEPLLRLNVEAQDEDIMVKIRNGVLGLVRQGQDEEEPW